ncbi:tRNA (adenosine(37)-N6)-threonylcarbamoyltransferase complex ATPase subunit type 1 TsaE [bacterium]|nr:tRNA (adenosine(37)-N6)-threonylcarbamoyltransferase complex ATPase subunit type 1 TsaE [bacterium]
MTERFVSMSEPETLSIAGAFAKTLSPGTLVALTGELGTGKTVFARGVALGLGVKEKVTSPTFTLINEYRGQIPLYHMDLYRLNSKREIEDIGVSDYFYGNGICIVEWAEKLDELMPENTVSVSFRQIDPNRREIIIERPG